MNTIKRTTGVISAILFAFLGFSGVYLYNAGFKPASYTPSKVKVRIKSGMTTGQIAELLENRKVIRSKNAFVVLAKIYGKTGQLKAGVYELDGSKTLIKILKSLLYGNIMLRHVTVPEGLTIRQTAEIMAKAGFCDAQPFVDAAKDKKLIERFKINGRDAEGYLMPETYLFPQEASAKEIVTMMIATFFKKVEPIRMKYRPGAILEFKDVITMASIIEKETGSRQEYKIIASVFHNRLKKDMRLQADPTVIYGLPAFDGNLRKKDLRYDSPYNTYRYKGLPPGPIASPGLAAIEAAYNPNDSTYLYFVAMNKNGRHYFSRTLKEHNRAVTKYQLRGKRK
ncbi:MAG: aminodeoxychorismate lyase [bacterium]|nr:MAG: aminodeoxychorismate lyase [bacterium]